MTEATAPTAIKMGTSIQKTSRNMSWAPPQSAASTYWLNRRYFPYTTYPTDYAGTVLYPLSKRLCTPAGVPAPTYGAAPCCMGGTIIDGQATNHSAYSTGCQVPRLF